MVLLVYKSGLPLKINFFPRNLFKQTSIVFERKLFNEMIHFKKPLFSDSLAFYQRSVMSALFY